MIGVWTIIFCQC